MNMVRTGLAVAAGFILWSVLWVGGNQVLTVLMPGSFDADGAATSTGALILLLVLSVIYSVGAGFLTAVIARSQKLIPVIVLGVLLLIVGILVQSGYWNVMPLWYHLLFLGLLIPASVLGGWLRQRK